MSFNVIIPIYMGEYMSLLGIYKGITMEILYGII